MKILRCDKCGHEVVDGKGIVGREFDRFGFETLAPAFRFGAVVDVCAACFKEVQAADRAATKELEAVKRKSFLAKLGVG